MRPEPEVQCQRWPSANVGHGWTRRGRRRSSSTSAPTSAGSSATRQARCFLIVPYRFAVCAHAGHSTVLEAHGTREEISVCKLEYTAIELSEELPDGRPLNLVPVKWLMSPRRGCSTHVVGTTSRARARAWPTNPAWLGSAARRITAAGLGHPLEDETANRLEASSGIPPASSGQSAVLPESRLGPGCLWMPAEFPLFKDAGYGRAVQAAEARGHRFACS